MIIVKFANHVLQILKDIQKNHILILTLLTRCSIMPRLKFKGCRVFWMPCQITIRMPEGNKNINNRLMMLEMQLWIKSRLKWIKDSVSRKLMCLLRSMVISVTDYMIIKLMIWMLDIRCVVMKIGNILIWIS